MKGRSLARALRRNRAQSEIGGRPMAKDPREQQKTDAQRVPDSGTGKLDADNSRMPEEEQPEHRRFPPDEPQEQPERP